MVVKRLVETYTGWGARQLRARVRVGEEEIAVVLEEDPDLAAHAYHLLREDFPWARMEAGETPGLGRLREKAFQVFAVGGRDVRAYTLEERGWAYGALYVDVAKALEWGYATGREAAEAFLRSYTARATGQFYRVYLDGDEENWTAVEVADWAPSDEELVRMALEALGFLSPEPAASSAPPSFAFQGEGYLLRSVFEHGVLFLDGATLRALQNLAPGEVRSLTLPGAEPQGPYDPSDPLFIPKEWFWSPHDLWEATSPLPGFRPLEAKATALAGRREVYLVADLRHAARLFRLPRKEEPDLPPWEASLLRPEDAARLEKALEDEGEVFLEAMDPEGEVLGLWARGGRVRALRLPSEEPGGWEEDDYDLSLLSPGQVERVLEEALLAVLEGLEES